MEIVIGAYPIYPDFTGECIGDTFTIHLTEHLSQPIDLDIDGTITVVKQ